MDTMTLLVSFLLSFSCHALVTPQTPNPLCPIGSGRTGPAGTNSPDTSCPAAYGGNLIASDFFGQLRCGNFDCCMCQEISCGLSTTPCSSVQIGDSGAVGVKNIHIQGGMNAQGATLDCNGVESCKNTFIRGKYVNKINCMGDFGCEASNMVISNPSPQLSTLCQGLMSCFAAVIEINIGTPMASGQCAFGGQTFELGGFDFIGQSAADSATIVINNYNCAPVVIPHIRCTEPISCAGARFVLSGNIQVPYCELTDYVSGLETVCAKKVISSTPAQNNAIPVEPAAPVPVVTLPWSVPTQTASTPGLPYGSDQQLICGPDGLCKGKELTIVPRQDFSVSCLSFEACANMKLTVAVGLDPVTRVPVTSIGGFEMIGPNSGQNAHIHVENTLGAVDVDVNFLHCLGRSSCVQFGLSAGQKVKLTKLDRWCAKHDDCEGCKITKYEDKGYAIVKNCDSEGKDTD